MGLLIIIPSIMTQLSCIKKMKLWIYNIRASYVTIHIYFHRQYARWETELQHFSSNNDKIFSWVVVWNSLMNHIWILSRLYSCITDTTSNMTQINIVCCVNSNRFTDNHINVNQQNIAITWILVHIYSLKRASTIKLQCTV